MSFHSGNACIFAMHLVTNQRVDVLAQVYGEHSEGVNFRRNMAALLGLPADASCAKIIKTVTRQLIGSDGEES